MLWKLLRSTDDVIIDPKPKTEEELNFNQFQFENFNNDDGNLFEQLRAIL